MLSPLIAVVDGEAVFLTLMTDLLTDAGYQVRATPLQTDTYATLRSAPPALLVLDLPVFQPDTVWTLVSLLRLDPTTALVPIIMCSAATDLLRNSTLRLQSLHCAVLEKPFDLDELLRLIRELLAGSGTLS